jgi:hypothetical protein
MGHLRRQSHSLVIGECARTSCSLFLSYLCPMNLRIQPPDNGHPRISSFISRADLVMSVLIGSSLTH